MLKFEYNHLKNTLYTQKLDSSRQPITKTFTGNYQAQGFILEPTNHWITFTTYPNRIKVFYIINLITELKDSNKFKV